jgi:hypothetical protein
MSEEDRTLETVVKMLSTCIEQRDTLKRERDEARAKYEDLYVMAYGKDGRDTWVAEAEARGFERGVREAAKVLTDQNADWWQWGDGNPEDNDLQVTRIVCKEAAAAILALLEPTLQEPEA